MTKIRMINEERRLLIVPIYASATRTFSVRS